MFVMLSVRTSTVCERQAETTGQEKVTIATTPTTYLDNIIFQQLPLNQLHNHPKTTLHNNYPEHLQSQPLHSINNIRKPVTKSVSYDKNINNSTATLLLTELNNFKQPPTLQVSAVNLLKWI